MTKSYREDFEIDLNAIKVGGDYTEDLFDR